MKYKNFTSLLLQWHTTVNKREMPWKGVKDPYKVWLSEIILQQTRVEQGWAYYEKFIKQYPTIRQLANAKDDDVFKLWEGLGYYTRCKNLLHTARFIVKEYKGVFPENYEEIIALKGIGVYTAAAIASFCFDLPYAVVDGNVFRVLSRVYGNATPVDSNEGKKIFSELATKVLDKNKPGIFNQAIMDFGATVCKPALPLCAQCPINKICIAFKNATVNILPVKEKVLDKKIRWFTYFIFEANGKVLARKRIAKDIWQNLFEYYLVETAANPLWSNESIAELLCNQAGIKDFKMVQLAAAQSQKLTHQHIKGYFIHITLSSIPQNLKGDTIEWVKKENLKLLPFPAFINEYVKNKKKLATLF
ncbi:MAG: A/G-specific adenine glycosylase [Panacibacter sp.]